MPEVKTVVTLSLKEIHEALMATARNAANAGAGGSKLTLVQDDKTGQLDSAVVEFTWVKKNG